MSKPIVEMAAKLIVAEGARLLREKWLTGDPTEEKRKRLAHRHT